MINYISRHGQKAIFGALFAIFLFSYAWERVKTRNQLITDAGKIYAAISEPLDYVNTMTLHLGHKIADNNKSEDHYFIYNLFRETAQMQSAKNQALSWALFSWGDKRHQLAVTTMGGVISSGKSLIEREYTWRAVANRWSLQFSKPDFGNLSNVFVLPAAVGVSDSRDRFLGTVIVGISIKNLLNKSELAVTSGNSFIVANRDSDGQDYHRVIFSSSNSPKKVDEEKFSKIITKYRDWMEHSGTMVESFRIGKIKYSYYRMMENYPLIILVGFNYVDFWVNVFATAIKLIISLLVVVVLRKKNTRMSH